MEFIKEKSTNLRFRFTSYFSKNALKLYAHAPTVFFLGHEFRPSGDREELAQQQRALDELATSVAWFSYSKGLEPITVNGARSLESDLGWGCMIRAGQMMIFMAIARVMEFDRTNRHNLIKEFFRETKQNGAIGDFALQRFVQVAGELFEKAPGSWFRSTTFVMAFAKMLKRVDALHKILGMYNVTENVFYWRKLANRAFGEKRNFVDIDHCINELKTRAWSRNVILTISTVLGMTQIDMRYLPILNGLVRLKSFVGFLGGETNKAYYFVGSSSQNTFYYIDPHFCRPAFTGFDNVEAIREHFFSKEFFTIPASKMSSSVTVCLLLRGPEDFAELIECLRKLATTLGEEYFFCEALDKEELKTGDEQIVTF